jgi:hypothetical protein
MDFSDMMTTFIGRNVECFLEGQFLAGKLVDVTEGTLRIQVIQNIYSPLAGQVVVLNPSIDFVRVLP